ncbi:unnamed protein product, partial [Ectocarpus sp. 8 AP-2014]
GGARGARGGPGGAGPRGGGAERGGGGGGGESPFLRASSSGSMDRSSAHQPQPHMQQHRQQQPQHMQQQHQMQHRFGGASPMSEQSSPHDDARGGGGGGGGVGSMGYLPPLAAAGGQEGGMPMGGPAVEEVGSSARGMGDFRPGQTPMVSSLSRLLENLEHTLEAPLAEEMYTPIGQRNSFCAQMVNIAQVLEEDSSLQQQGAEGESRSHRYSYLAQKRRSSVTELAYYLQDMLDEGESNRMITNTPGWTLPPPMPSTPGSLEGAFPSREGSGSGNRVTFKRTAPEDFESYGEYGMGGNVGGGGGGGSSRQAADGMGGPPDASNEVGPSSFNLKRARGGPQMAERFPSGREGPAAGGGGGGGGGGMGRHGRRMSEARMNAKVAASPSVVQALTCLASGLPETSDSEENTQESTAAAAAGVALSPSSSSTEPQARGGGGAGVKREELMPHKVSEERPDGEAAAAGREMPMPNARRGSKAINDVVTKFSIDQALEQLKGEEEGGEGRGGGGRGGGGGGGEDRGEPNPSEQSSDKQRASVYVLMHAIAAVDTANDEMFGEEEPLDGVETEAAI